jgi:hypothetical protein
MSPMQLLFRMPILTFLVVLSVASLPLVEAKKRVVSARICGYSNFMFLCLVKDSILGDGRTNCSFISVGFGRGVCVTLPVVFGPAHLSSRVVIKVLIM